MKKSILSIAMAVLLAIPATGYAQKNEKSDYNLRKAYELLEHNEADQVAIMELARSMLMRKDYQGVIELANKCENIDENYSGIYQFRMQAYYQLGETDKAIEDAIKYYEMDKNSDINLTEPIFKKHPNYAVTLVKNMIAKTEYNKKWKELLASIYEWGHDYVNAIKEYNNMEREYGASKYLSFFRSGCYFEIGDNENAIKEINKCIEVSDGDDYYISLTRRADIYQGTAQYEKAIIDYTKLIEMDSLEASVYKERGWCYEFTGDTTKAMEDYNAGIDISKDYSPLYMIRGRLHRKQGNMELAKSDFEKVLELDTIAESGSSRHYALLFLDKKEESVAWMDKVIETDTENNRFHYNKACLLALMGEQEQALAALKTALEKGYRSFAYIEHDSDMDSIRDLPEFVALIEEYKAKSQTVIESLTSKQ